MKTLSTRLPERSSSASGNGRLVVALPEPGLSMTQDAEWCVVRVGKEWRQIRFHDYDELFRIPGLYEKVIYDVLRCDSPRTVRELLEAALERAGERSMGLRVLDLGAGNGMVGEQCGCLHVERLVGVDLIPEAADATERDRPGLYDDYRVLDLTLLSEGQRQELAANRFNTLTCVAALGFGDIPPQVFAAAYNLIDAGGWVAFNIKQDFLTDTDSSGFACMIHRICENGMLEIRERRRYTHRLSTDGRPLFYSALVGRKHRDIEAEMIPT